MKREEGLAIARRFRSAVELSGYPVQRVVLYGSVARDQAHEDSDIDIAVICFPFGKTRHEENMAMRRLRRKIDVRIEPFCLHPDDFGKPCFSLPYEVERDGVEV
jgi:predicted nucleotidyltransferase